MPLPLSRSQLDKLGKRLAAGVGPPSPEDRALLQSVLAAYAVVLDEVVGELRDLGFEPTSRVKTEDVLIEKLRRHAQRGSSMGLKGMQDIAGARIVVDGGRGNQDDAVHTIMERFAAKDRVPRSIDRRSSPSVGYRAVHVIVWIETLPVEVQVRTRYQDTWAQLMEAMGDVWGRGVRYGEGPDQPSRVMGGGDIPRELVWSTALRMSDLIASLETTAEQAAEIAALAPSMQVQVDGLTQLHEDLRNFLEGWKRIISEERE
ncbi:MAG: RelA/SpoT domain-containing protein [Kineosporiaceae bacterium]